MKCKNCGKNNDSDAKYCKYCGSALEEKKIFDVNKRLEELEKIKTKLKLEEKIGLFIDRKSKNDDNYDDKTSDDKDYPDEEIYHEDNNDYEKEKSDMTKFSLDFLSKLPFPHKVVGILLITLLILSPIFSKLASNKNNNHDYEKSIAIDLKSYDTTIRVKNSANLFFSTYDIKIYVDDKDQTVIKNGEETEFTLKLDEGSHMLKISKASDESVFGEIHFNVNDNNKLQFQALSHRDNIEIQSENYEENIVEEEKEESPDQSPEEDIDETSEKINEEKEESSNPVKKETTEDMGNNEDEDGEQEEDQADEVITVENNDDFNNLLVPIDDLDPRIKEFSEKYYGKTIEFDGIIADIQNHSTMYGKVYKTRFNVLVYAGDGFESTYGPAFSFTNISMGKLPSITSSGYPVKIRAEVRSYNEKNGLFELYPISIKTR